MQSGEIPDPWNLYTSFMTAWLESSRSGAFAFRWDGDPLDPRREIFELMWSAYEDWVSRGATQYWQVAVELERFYAFLRREMVARRDDPIDLLKERKELADAAVAYLSQVRNIGSDSFDRFSDDMSRVLKRIQDSSEEEPGNKKEGPFA